MKTFCLSLFVICSHAAAQDLHRISLHDHYLPADSIPVRIADIIDGRKDKNVIGLVQLGINNRKEFAGFEKPGLEEIEDLFRRSHLLETSEESIVIRITRLYVSELTLFATETGKAELSIDFFKREDDESYSYISSVYASHESKLFDVTPTHDENIVAALRKALLQFGLSKKNESSSMVFSREELADPEMSFRDLSSLPILQTTSYKSGFYTSFDELVNNSPSIDIDCKVKLGNKVKLKCNESSQELQTNIYGFSKDNQLYVLFHRQFYLLEKENNSFYFIGPRMPGNSSSAYLRGWIMAGAVGGAMSARNAGYNLVYKVDLSTGSFKAVTGVY